MNLTYSIFCLQMIFLYSFFAFIKISKDSSAKSYQNKKEKLQKSLWKISKSKEEKGKEQQYGRERYKNLPEDEKQKLVEYKKTY